MKSKRAALYMRVSTNEQTTGNQRMDLEAAAATRGWEVVATYDEAVVSGSKGRDERPKLDAMLKGRGTPEVRRGHGLGCGSPGTVTA